MNMQYCQKKCRNYIVGITSKEELEIINKEADEKIEEYLSKFEKELNHKMIDDKIVINMQKEKMQDFIQNKNNFTQVVITKYEREPVKIKKYVFDDDQVTVTFDSSVDIEEKYLSEEGEKIKKDNLKSPEESITLKNVEGAWRVVYADYEYYTGSSIPQTFISY